MSDINPTQINDFLSEAEKEKKEYMILITDLTIAELVKEKDAIKKAYNYYDGVLDKDQYRHLEEVYGISAPTSVEFIPLVRPHIDLLVGELLQIPFKPKITCKDKRTLNNINRDKQLAVAKKLYDETAAYVNNTFLTLIMLSEGEQTPKGDPFTLKKLEELKQEITQGFISEYEIAAQYLIEHFKQNRYLDFLNKRKQVFLDLLVAGQCYYNTSVDKVGALPELERLHPLDTFVEKSPNSPYINRSNRAVVRRRLTKQEILVRYGNNLSKDDLKLIETFIQPTLVNNDNYYISSGNAGIIAGVSAGVLGSTNGSYDYTTYYKDRYVVYEVQWLSANKYEDEEGNTRFRMDRYRSIKINDEIYILLGKDDNVFRSLDAPDECYLTINGVCYEDSKGQPSSLMLNTANLQDKYNILHYHRDNLIALSGVKGSAIETSMIPNWLGETPESRFAKFIAYKKTGTAPLDASQMELNMPNTALFQAYDDTLSGQALQAIQEAISQTEEVCARITGVFRERLGGIEQKDAVSNVQVGIRQSAIITKQYYQIIDLTTKEMLNDLINFCKISFKENEFTGSIVLGDNLIKIFTIKPDHFLYTDYDIHVDDSGDIVRDMQKIEQITLELVKAGALDIDVILASVGMLSMTQMKFEVTQLIDKKRKENNQLLQLQQQLQEAQAQLQQLQLAMQKTQKENDLLKLKDRELEKYKIDKDYEIRKYTVDKSGVIGEKKLTLDTRRVELEQMQLLDNNPLNDEIRNL